MFQDGPVDGDGSALAPSAPTEDLPEGFLAPGQVLGDRYQIRSQLGRGGMGEVWRGFDLKLRVEVGVFPGWGDGADVVDPPVVLLDRGRLGPARRAGDCFHFVV